MSTSTTERLYTPEDLLEMPYGGHFELVDGMLVERNVGVLSAWIAGEIHALLRGHCRAHHLGWVWPAEVGYRCFPDAPDKVRRPDASFIQVGRLPEKDWAKGYLPIVPDLVVEVNSPNDLASEVEVKVEEYLGAGVRLVWVVAPETRVVQIHRADGSSDRVRSHEELSGEDVLPGFRCPVRDLFPPDPGSKVADAPPTA